MINILEARRALHWRELGNEILDTNLGLFYGKTKFAAQLSNFSGAVDTVLAAKQSMILLWMNHFSMGVTTAPTSVNIIDE